jgi:hypothetical protein
MQHSESIFCQQTVKENNTKQRNKALGSCVVYDDESQGSLNP